MVLSLRYVVHVAYDGLNMSVTENSLLEALQNTMQESFSRQLSHEYPSEKNSSADSSHVKLKICKVTLFHTFSPHATSHHHRYTFTKCYDNSKDNADAIKITTHTQVTYSHHSVAYFFCTMHTSNKVLVEDSQYLWGPLIRVQSA